MRSYNDLNDLERQLKGLGGIRRTEEQKQKTLIRLKQSMAARPHRWQWSLLTRMAVTFAVSILFVSFLYLLMADSFSLQRSGDTGQTPVTLDLMPQRNVEHYFAQVTVSASTQLKQAAKSFQLWYQAPDQYRIDYADGSVTVTDGRVSYTFQPELTQSITFAFGNHEVRWLTESVKGLVNSDNVEKRGVEQIAGRPAAHYSFQWRLPLDLTGHLTVADAEVWLDEETMIPLQLAVQLNSEQLLIRFDHINYDRKVEENMFSVEHLREDMQEVGRFVVAQQLDLETIQKQVDFKVPQIERLPPGFEKTESYYEAESNMVSILYEGSDSFLLLVVIPMEHHQDGLRSHGVRVNINGTEGVLTKDEEQYMLTWRMGNLMLWLRGTGPGVNQTLMQQMAEQVKN